jgi:exopolysaccharide biosynthesis polyprenyl glycosylphosphotransferase
MLRRFSLNYAILSLLIDAVGVLLALQLSVIMRPMLNSTGWFAVLPGPAIVPAALYLLFPFVWVGVLASMAIYDGKRYIRAVDEFTALSLASALAVVALAGILYFSFRDVSRAQYLLFVLLAYGALLGWRIVARAIFRLKRQNAPQVSRRVVIVGCGPLGRMVEARLTGEAAMDIALLGFVDDEIAEGFNGSLLGSASQLAGIVDINQATDIVVALPPHFYERIRLVVSSVSELPVKVWIALGFYDLALYRTVTEDLAGLPLLDLRASALDDYERFAKRVFDLLMGTLALLLVSPVLLAAALVVRICDGRPILFRQVRVGENGRLFTILKLRTMVTNDEAVQAISARPDETGEVVRKRKDDPRITPTGRVLRRLSVDELPQLMNVLRGEMSLVGPRPELPQLVESYEPWQRQRLAVPPGMTGWWQVTGRSDRIMHLHTEDDVYYIRNYSIWLDLQILVRTVWVVVLGRGAY